MSQQTEPPARRHLAHLPACASSPIVFFTTTTHSRRKILDQPFAHEVMHDIWSQSADRNGWFVGDYILMPDHVHFFARAASESDPMADWVKMWKSLSSRRLAKHSGSSGPVWQTEYFDRYLRSDESYSQKWAYVEMNPVRAGLAPSPEAWRFKGRIHVLQY